MLRVVPSGLGYGLRMRRAGIPRVCLPQGLCSKVSSAHAVAAIVQYAVHVCTAAQRYCGWANRRKR